MADNMRDDMRNRPGLMRLEDMDDFDVADGYPDIRGWDVKNAAGETIGEVHGLVVDTRALEVRYMDVDLDHDHFDLDDDRHVLVPIGGARLNDDDDVVMLGGITDRELLAAPAFDHGRFDDTAHSAYRDHYGRSKLDRDMYDERGFWGGRAGKSERSLVRSEEELAVGKRQAKAGEVDVTKHTTTEHVKKEVPVTREQVTVERRPVSGDTPLQATRSADEIRMPVMEEEIVTEKRMVPKEEVVIRKEQVQETRTVEADLKKERLDVDAKGKVRRADTERGTTERRPNV